MKYHQVVVVGAGLAGLRAAIECNRHNVKVAVLSKVHPLRSHSLAAQGGVNASLGNNLRGGQDSWEKHAFDTVKGSDYLADQDAVQRFTKEAPERIYEMDHWGCPFTRDGNGLIAQRPFGGAGFPRTCYAADLTGHVLLHSLYEKAVAYELNSERENFVFYDEYFASGLLVEDGKCQGVAAIRMDTGEIEAIRADAVIMATGGAGRLFGNTTNALISTAYGMAMPYWKGVALKDMEFVQFHPTSLFGTNILMTEGCRGEGGYLMNNKGDRFLANYSDSAKAMEVAPRDIVARNITRELLEGRGFGKDNGEYVHLDLRHLGKKKIMTRLPGIRDLSINFVEVGPIIEPIPVQPGTHYSMGGIDTDGDGRTEMPGLYAAGECGCVSVHGANRLGGNSLLETLVYGKISGESAAEDVIGGLASDAGDAEKAFEGEKEFIEQIRAMDGDELPADLRDELQEIMVSNVSVFREGKKLKQAHEKVQELRERYKNIKVRYKGARFNWDLIWAMQLKANLDVAEALVKGALDREECRGSHFRADFTSRDDEKWLKHTLAFFEDKGARMDSKEVTLGKWVPKERKY
ncbi:MAG: FAD-binding protein [Planctomycetota bacterium]|nr:FAD-binding protein [Planctomycetota bacterium]